MPVVVVACCFITSYAMTLLLIIKKWNIAKWKGNRFWYDYAKVRTLLFQYDINKKTTFYTQRAVGEAVFSFACNKSI